MKKGPTQIIPDIIESIPEVIHNKKSITKSINAKISYSDVKTKRCVFPFKYKDMIYKNCINYENKSDHNQYVLLIQKVKINTVFVTVNLSLFLN